MQCIQLQDVSQYLGNVDSSQLERIQNINHAIEFCAYLESNGISYDYCVKHQEVLGCDESSHYYERFLKWLSDDYVVCKNLLLHERKGEKRNYLLIVDSRKKVDFKSLQEVLDCKKLEFVKDEEMEQLIKTTSGNVSLFNIMYDEDSMVHLLIDEELQDAPLLAFHPLYNGMSLFLKPSECSKFLDLINREAQVISVSDRDAKQFRKKFNN